MVINMSTHTKESEQNRKKKVNKIAKKKIYVYNMEFRRVYIPKNEPF
jgi:hypothetical protein